MIRSLLFAAAFLCGAVPLSAPRAQSTDPADLAFYQSVQASNDPAELKTYLDAFPQGRFHALVEARLRNLGASAPGQAAPPVAPAAAHTPRIVVAPPAGAVGETYTISCIDFPQEQYGQLVVVPAGSPVMDPSRGREQTGALWSNFAKLACVDGQKVGPFAPGSYEFRWMTALYNNDNRLELKATTPLVVQ